MLTKPWNLYVFRHSALTEKSQYLTESILRSHAGWTMSSKMPQVYIHLSGESSKILLEKRGIISKRDKENLEELRSRQCPNCSEPNRRDSRFCSSCRMILSYDAYTKALEEKTQKESEIKTLAEKYDKGMKEMREYMNYIISLIQENPKLAKVKTEVLTSL
jgi:predicted nucleic acid-binding Zn ribbon protein